MCNVKKLSPTKYNKWIAWLFEFWRSASFFSSPFKNRSANRILKWSSNQSKPLLEESLFRYILQAKILKKEVWKKEGLKQKSHEIL